MMQIVQGRMKVQADRMLQEALSAVDPFNLLKQQLHFDGTKLTIGQRSFNLPDYENIYLVGAGKGTAPMAAALEEILGDHLSKGAIVVKYGHGQVLKKTAVYEAGHPLPDQNTLTATREILELTGQAGTKDLVFVLISGGGSALFEQLPAEIELDHLASLNDLLLSSGASIEEINTVRKHLSMVKGGQLAGYIAPARTIALILSDVIGDPLASIASGPTVPDPSSFAEAVKIIERYNLKEQIPETISRHLESGRLDEINETPKQGDRIFDSVDNIIIGNNRLALNRLQQVAEAGGRIAIILTDQAQGEACEIARFMAAVFKSYQLSAGQPGALIIGGEPTVTLKGNGLGGRNQELCLAVLKALKNVRKPFYFCSVGTDGTDGPTDAAGAWIDHQSYLKARAETLDIDDYLQRNDSYHFFEEMDQLIFTGPTRTNVMDVMFFLY